MTAEAVTRRISSKHVRATQYDRHSLEVLDRLEHDKLCFSFVTEGTLPSCVRGGLTVIRKLRLILPGTSGWLGIAAMATSEV